MSKSGLLVAISLCLAMWSSSSELSASPKVSKQTVVLLHGLGRGPWSLKLLEWRLQRFGYEVHNLEYNPRSPTIELAAQSVYKQIQNCCGRAEKIHFVTHSLGGLVLRALLNEHTIENSGLAVMLAPPNGGSQIVDRFARYRLFAGVFGPIAQKLGTGDNALPYTLPAPTIPFAIIAGNRWWNPLGALLLPGANDGTVTVESTKLTGMTDHLVVPHTHTFLMNSREVATAVRTFLQTGQFKSLCFDTSFGFGAETKRVIASRVVDAPARQSPHAGCYLNWKQP